MVKLSEEEKLRISQLAERVEAGTGVQVLAVVAGKCDTYREIPWKAFSLGTSLAALSFSLIVTIPTRIVLPTGLWTMIILGTGLVCALTTIFCRPAARLFLAEDHAGTEANLFALKIFHDRGLGKTRSRNGILVLASQFERRAALVADTGIVERIPREDLDGISTILDTALKQKSTSAALVEGLSALEELLRSRGFDRPSAAGDEIKEEFLEMEGPKP